MGIPHVTTESSTTGSGVAVGSGTSVAVGSGGTGVAVGGSAVAVGVGSTVAVFVTTMVGVNVGSGSKVGSGAVLLQALSSTIMSARIRIDVSLRMGRLQREVGDYDFESRRTWPYH